MQQPSLQLPTLWLLTRIKCDMLGKRCKVQVSVDIPSLRLPTLQLPTVSLASLVRTFELCVLRFCGFWQAQNATCWAKDVRFKDSKSVHSNFAATIFTVSHFEAFDFQACYLNQEIPTLRPQILQILEGAKYDMLGKRCKVQCS